MVGRNCDQCPEQFWGLSEHEDGCKPCNCDPGGAYDNICDVVSGQCKSVVFLLLCCRYLGFWGTLT